MTVGYSVSGYGEMIVDNRRMQAYVAALRQAVRPGCTVADIGAGTGIFSLLACQFGAGRVHAVEPGDVIEVARATAIANGFQDRITFHQGLSTNLQLQERAQVIISDLRGVMPFLQSHIPAIADARRRLLAENGVLIPQQDTLWAALLENSGFYGPYVEPWISNPYGLDLRAGHHLVVNSWRKAATQVQEDQILVQPQKWCTLDYRTITNPNVSAELSWTVQRSGTAHGIILWFDAELCDGIGFSNAPAQPRLVYGQAFLPLQSPIALDEGDTVEVQLKANLTEGEYVWIWNTRVTSRIVGKIKADFRQSTFLSDPISPAKLRRHEARFVPAPNQAADRPVLPVSGRWPELHGADCRKCSQSLP